MNSSIVQIDKADFERTKKGNLLVKVLIIVDARGLGASTAGTSHASMTCGSDSLKT